VQQLKDGDSTLAYYEHCSRKKVLQRWSQMLAANTIRQVAEEENLSCKIGFFLHIPFPSFDIVKVFPWEDMIIQVQSTNLLLPVMVLFQASRHSA
jgi:trehalose-6-phosphate synthase